MPVKLFFLLTMLLCLCIVARRPDKMRRASPRRQRKDKDNCFIVKFKQSTTRTRKKELFDAVDGEDGQQHNNTGSFVKCSCRMAQLEDLGDDDDIDYIEEDQAIYPDITQTVNSLYWNLDRVDQSYLPLDLTFNYQYTGQGIPIYVLDTGVNGSHEEFTGRMGKGIDLVDNGDPFNDCNGHGTHAAGTAAGTRSGIAKLATVVPVRVMGCTGGTVSTTVAGINWVLTQPIGVLSLSLGAGLSQSLNDAVALATSKGYHVVVSAGNNNADACTQSPAAAPSAITVGATSRTDQRSSYSNWGPCVDIFAPGDNIYSALNTDMYGYTTKSGTSMSTPLVAGAIAAYLSGNPSITPNQMIQVLQNEGTKGVVIDAKNSSNLLLKSSGIPNLNSRSPSPSPLSQSPSASPVSPSPSPAGPKNDACVDAFPLPCNSVVSGTTLYATMEGTLATCTVSRTSPDVWYYVDVPAAGTLTLSTCNMANFDTKLTLWGGSCTAASLASLTCVIGVDDTSGCAVTSRLSQAVQPGRYMVMVHAYKTAMGNFNLSVTCPAAPPTASPSRSPPFSSSPSPQASRSPSPVPSPSPLPRPSPSPTVISSTVRTVEDTGSQVVTKHSSLLPVVYGLIASTSVLFGFVVGVGLVAWLVMRHKEHNSDGSDPPTDHDINRQSISYSEERNDIDGSRLLPNPVDIEGRGPGKLGSFRQQSSRYGKMGDFPPQNTAIYPVASQQGLRRASTSPTYHVSPLTGGESSSYLEQTKSM